MVKCGLKMFKRSGWDRYEVRADSYERSEKREGCQ